MRKEFYRRCAKRAISLSKAADVRPLDRPLPPTFEETYPTLPFAELVRLSLLLARWLNRAGGRRIGEGTSGFGARRLAPNPPGGGRTARVVAPGGACDSRRGAAPLARPHIGIKRRSA